MGTPNKPSKSGIRPNAVDKYRMQLERRLWVLEKLVLSEVDEGGGLPAVMPEDKVRRLRALESSLSHHVRLAPSSRWIWVRGVRRYIRSTRRQAIRLHVEKRRKDARLPDPDPRARDGMLDSIIARVPTPV